MIVVTEEQSFLNELRNIVESARSRAYTAINFAQVESNWLIGRQIVEQEQKGETRAEYGAHIVELASKVLTEEFGKGFSERNLWKFKQFYITFNDLPILPTASAESASQNIDKALDGIVPTVSAQLAERSYGSGKKLCLLSWSHYERLLRIDSEQARDWYMQEAYSQNWSYRTLDRNISSQYYERLLSSQIKQPVEAEMNEKTVIFQRDKLSFIKNPTVLEFLGLPGNAGHTETEIEEAILLNIQRFILELGKGFAFVERQKLVRTEAHDYFLDMVFYNYILKCFVLIDLKTTRITHQDVGQMDMYVRMFDERERSESDNPTIGIVLCSETDHDIARYSILKGNEHLFASKYKLFMPTEDELRAEIERQKEILRIQFSDGKGQWDWV